MATWHRSLLAATLLLSACTLGVQWKNHASFRTSGKELRLSHIDADEAVEGVISAKLHYMAVALDSVFVRNLPGLFDRSVALGLEITGALPNGKSIQTVLDVKKGVGENAFLSFDNVAVIEPFLYTGQNFTIALHFRAVPADEVSNLKGRLQGAGDIVKKIHPAGYQALETGMDLFRSIMGAFMKKELSWKYQFTLYPADSTYRDKPEMLLTAARHILMIMPPTDAWSDLRKLQPEKVIKYLKMRGNRLVWAHNDKEYTETPYIVLNITRFKRYPSTDTELRKVATQVDTAIEQRNLDHARAMLMNLGVAINNDKIITAQEKNLERSWKDYREARINMLEANKKGEKDAELRQIERMLKTLAHIRSHFTRILYPFETKNLDYEVSQKTLRAEFLAKELGVPHDDVLKIATAYRETARKLAEPPPRPPKAVVPLAMDLKKDPPPSAPSWKRYYQKWWFWTLVSLGASGAAAAGYAVTRPANVIPRTGVEVPFMGKISFGR